MNMARLIWRNDNLGTLCIAERAQSRCSAIYEKFNAEIFHTDIRSGKTRREYASCRGPGPKEFGDMHELVEVGEAATIDGLTRELDIKERLAAGIEKCLKTIIAREGT